VAPMRALALLVLLLQACANRPSPSARSTSVSHPMRLGLRTAIYAVPDIARAREWYSDVFGVAPYFNEPFYVGFNIGGYELGLMPAAEHREPGPGGALPYWGVESAQKAWEHLLSKGAEPVSPVQDVGEGIRVATVRDPFGNLLGIIENPHFPNTSP
jgi:predicted enzyme related to lactoylglutathione lyase